MTSVELVIPGKIHPQNAERSAHFRTSRKWTADTRKAAGWAAIAARIPEFDWMEISVYPFQAKGRLADVGAHMPSAKAAVDGLVDVGVIPDDDPRFVRSLTFFPPVRSKSDCLKLVMEGPISSRNPPTTQGSHI